MDMCSWSASMFFSSEKQTSRPTAHAQYISSVEIYLLLTAGRTVYTNPCVDLRFKLYRKHSKLYLQSTGADGSSVVVITAKFGK